MTLPILHEVARGWQIGDNTQFRVTKSSWQGEYLDKRHGALSMDDLMTMLVKMWDVTRRVGEPAMLVHPLNCCPPQADKDEGPTEAAPQTP